MDANKARRRSHKVFAEFVESHLFEIEEKIETKIALGSREITHLIPNAWSIETSMSKYYGVTNVGARKKNYKLARGIRDELGEDWTGTTRDYLLNSDFWNREIKLGSVLSIALQNKGFGTDWCSGECCDSDDSHITVLW